MTAPRVSIVMPVRDAAGTLPECLDSIAAQRLPQWELVAVDDGSRDRSDELLAARGRCDPRIRLLRNPGRGVAEALNAGLRAARAPYVARMDADDRMHPERLAAQVSCLDAHPEVTVVASRVEAFPAAAVGAGMREYLRWQNGCLSAADLHDEIFVEAPLAHPSVSFRRHTVLAHGGYRGGDFPEDYELWLRLDGAGCRLSKLPRTLLQWRQRPGSLSRVDPRYSRDAFDRLRARFLARDPRLACGRPLAWWGAGRRTRRRCRRLRALGFSPVAWIDVDPRKIGNRLEGAPVVAPAWLREHSGDAVRPFVLGWVASHGAREEIGARLVEMGYTRGRDFLMVG